MSKAIDPIVQKQLDYWLEHQRNFGGPVVPRHLIRLLFRLLAQEGDRPRKHKDDSKRKRFNKCTSQWIAVHVMSHILDTHRAALTGNQFWEGAYYLRRKDLADELCTDVDTISWSLTFLARHGFIGRTHKTAIGENGKTFTQFVYVWPNIEYLDSLLEEEAKRIKSQPVQIVGPNVDVSPKSNKELNLRKSGSSYSKSRVQGSEKVGLKVGKKSGSSSTTSSTGKANKRLQQSSPSFSPSARKGSPSVRPLKTADDDKAKPGEVAQQRFEVYQEAFALVYPAVFGIPPVISDKDKDALITFFEDERPSYFLAVQVEAWAKIGAKADNGYRYGACQNSKKPTHLIRHWDRIISDVGLADFDLSTQQAFNQNCGQRQEAVR
jgi:hypothetical protein